MATMRQGEVDGRKDMGNAFFPKAFQRFHGSVWNRALDTYKKFAFWLGRRADDGCT